jgi:hypothetical protein
MLLTEVAKALFNGVSFASVAGFFNDFLP